MNKVCAHGDCCKVMHTCVRECLGLYKAHAAKQMHARVGVCVLVCTRRIVTVIAAKQMHACIGVCLWTCTRHMVTAMAMGKCMLMLFCVSLCTRRMLTVIAAR